VKYIIGQILAAFMRKNIIFHSHRKSLITAGKLTGLLIMDSVIYEIVYSLLVMPSSTKGVVALSDAGIRPSVRSSVPCPWDKNGAF